MDLFLFHIIVILSNYTLCYCAIDVFALVYTALLIQPSIFEQVISQEFSARWASTLFNHNRLSVAANSFSAASINSAALFAMCTSLFFPYGLITSLIGVE